MKSSWIKWSVLPAASLLVGGVAMAHDQSSAGSQSSSSESGSSMAPTPAPAEKPKPAIAERKENQQDRIANGGKLNAGRKQQINREQNAALRNIHRKKHNARTQPEAGKP